MHHLFTTVLVNVNKIRIRKQTNCCESRPEAIMSSSAVMASGVFLAAVGIAGRRLAVLLSSPAARNTLRSLWASSRYYRGGFEPRMTPREASRVLGLPGPSSSSSRTRVSEAHKRMMMLNHPDRGGSPYLATKINQAREMLMKSATNK